LIDGILSPSKEWVSFALGLKVGPEDKRDSPALFWILVYDMICGVLN
jgi:hypothetical protein